MRKFLAYLAGALGLTVVAVNVLAHKRDRDFDNHWDTAPVNLGDRERLIP